MHASLLHEEPSSNPRISERECRQRTSVAVTAKFTQYSLTGLGPAT